MSGLSLDLVANDNTFWTRLWAPSGFFKNSLTIAVRVCNWTFNWDHAERKSSRHVFKLISTRPLDDRKEQKEGFEVNRLNWKRIVDKGIQESSQNFICIVDLLSIISQYPNQRGFAFRLVEVIQVRAKCRDDAFIPRGIFTEDVLPMFYNIISSMIATGSKPNWWSG